MPLEFLWLFSVIRSGDYYMFEDVKDDEEDIEEMDFPFPTDAAVTVEAYDDVDGVTHTPDWRSKKPPIGPIAVMCFYCLFW